MGKIRLLLRKIIFYFFAISIGGVLVFKFLPIPFTWTMLDRKVSAMVQGEDSKIHYKWRSYHKVSRVLHMAEIAAEDQNFPVHWGFDIKALQKAYVNNQKGRKVRGASTISQQVAKNVFLWQGRSYIRKALEVYF